MSRRLISPAAAGKWQRFVNELRDCLADKDRKTARLYSFAIDASASTEWPKRNDDDDALLSGALSLAVAYAKGNAGRRGWLRDVLKPLHEVVEGMTDDATPDGSVAELVKPTARNATSPPRAIPRQMRPDSTAKIDAWKQRRDIDG